jgi:hypothetical protein
MAEQAKGHIFSAKEDYLKSEQFVMVGDFELTRCLYSTMINDLGGIYYPGIVILPWDFEKELEPWETGDNPIVLDPEVIEIDDSESEENGSILNMEVDNHEEGDGFLEAQVPEWDWEDMEACCLPKVTPKAR